MSQGFARAQRLLLHSQSRYNWAQSQESPSQKSADSAQNMNYQSQASDTNHQSSSPSVYSLLHQKASLERTIRQLTARLEKMDESINKVNEKYERMASQVEMCNDWASRAQLGVSRMDAIKAHLNEVLRVQNQTSDRLEDVDVRLETCIREHLVMKRVVQNQETLTPKMTSDSISPPPPEDDSSKFSIIPVDESTIPASRMQMNQLECTASSDGVLGDGDWEQKETQSQKIKSRAFDAFRNSQEEEVETNRHIDLFDEAIEKPHPRIIPALIREDEFEALDVENTSAAKLASRSPRCGNATCSRRQSKRNFTPTPLQASRAQRRRVQF